MLRTAHRISSTEPVASVDTGFKTAMTVLSRVGPYRVHPFGVVIYSGLTIPWVRRHPPRYPVDGEYETLQFVRCAHYSSFCFPACRGLVVHAALRDAIGKVANVAFVKAECVGVIEADPLDVDRMEHLSERFPVSPNPMELCKYAGRTTQEHHWWEVVAPHWDAVAQEGDSVLVNLEVAARSRENAAWGVRWPLFPDKSLSWRALQDHGIVAGRALAMSSGVADLLLPMLPPAFWWTAHWVIE